MSWTAPTSGGPVTTYTVTPTSVATAQTPTTVTGIARADERDVAGLTNGDRYTFTVTAVEPERHRAGVGALERGHAVAAAIRRLRPAGQRAPRRASSLSVTPTATSPPATGSSCSSASGAAAGATAASVTDSAGNTYTELLHFKGSDETEMSVWSAPITSGGGTRPTVTVKTSASADIGAPCSEYSGLSSAADATVLDQVVTRLGDDEWRRDGGVRRDAGDHCRQRAGARHVRRLRVRRHADRRLRLDQRSNISNAGDMEMLSEDQLAAAGATRTRPSGPAPTRPG